VDLQSSTKTWQILAGTALICTVILSTVNFRHNFKNEFPLDWDETGYVNRVCLDQSVLRNDGFMQYAKQLLFEHRNAPPAYRMVVFPVELVTDTKLLMLRSLTLLSFLFTALILFLTGKEISSVSAGVVWAGAFSLSAGAFSADLWFGTETPLYPAIAGCLYAVARWFRRERPDLPTLGVLAVSTGIGALSKASFFGVFVPLIAAAVLLVWTDLRRRRSLLLIGAAVGGGALVATPWWLVNARIALGYAHSAYAYSRHSAPWLSAAAIDLFGIPFAIFVLVYFLWVVMRATTLWRIADRPVREFVIACLAACVPFVVLDILAVNHNMRLLTPVLLPAMGVVSVTLELGGPRQRKLVTVCIALLFVIQTASVAWSAISDAPDQWDWKQLRELAQASGLSHPSIVQLGYGSAFSPPQIEHPWACNGESVTVRWLWRYEQGPIDWRAVNDQIAAADIVVSAPGFQINSLDNQHNDELVAQLRAASDMWKATDLYFGANGESHVLVFIRQKSHTATP
jgi:hypothetical protein